MAANKVEFDLGDELSLLPTYCRSKESKQKNPIIDDPKAEEIITKIDCDCSNFKLPKQAYFTICLRAKKIDDYAQNFINNNSDTVIVQLGCGLSTRANRISNYTNFYDIDYSEIINFKQNFYQPKNKYQMLASSIIDQSWVDNLSADKNYLFIAEGSLMYLKKEDVKELVLKLQDKFPGSQLIFDSYNQKTVDKINKHQQKSDTGTKLEWGLDDAKELEGWSDEIKLIEEWYYTDSKEIKKLSIFYRLIFNFAKLLKPLKQAHRLLYYQL